MGNMEEVIKKEELEEIMKVKGEVRGDGMRSYADFILKEEGEKGLKRLEEAMAKLGYPIKSRQIKRMGFYPVGLWVLFVLTIKRIFNYDDNKFQEMGIFQIKSSLIIRVFMKYFFSLERTAKELPKIWRQYFTIGEFNVVELNKEKKSLILKLENFSLHPISCQIILGVLIRAVGMIIKGKASGEETRCVHRRDSYHEFLLRW